ncbi:MarR family winged helix-turn-helix transcriptional regulator [Methylobacterium sp. J-076]|uniref:MarR family winged helix-turn-helix transcriptional regulator n=1 Tax=Methylobacterium sp. J-076 TaxID=2836655 RepID=UPI001FBB633C|nr:MarR family transcriptional regulator [Methylobacterium sp. J-076]MCJ2011508.1 MarR family transcriptional regulator [Methylobacterium sp. J-076]
MTNGPSAPAEPKSRLRRAYVGLVVEVFRLNGDQLAIGNALGAGLGLTSARWQVLGTISLSPVPLPVAHIARNMGLARQAVQYSVDEMRADGLVRLEPNPHHKRAMLVAMTEKGEAAYRDASERHGRWAETLMADLPLERIEAASELLREVQRRIASSTDTPAATRIKET